MQQRWPGTSVNSRHCFGNSIRTRPCRSTSSVFVALPVGDNVFEQLKYRSASAHLLVGKNLNDPQKAMSLNKYMGKDALIQGLTFSVLVAALGHFVPGIFTINPTVASYIAQCLPQLALQQTIVSRCLVLEGLAIRGNHFKSTATGTAIRTAVGLWQIFMATAVIDIWARAVNTFSGMRLILLLLELFESK
jgi:Na+-driven multidrug efflux pump